MASACVNTIGISCPPPPSPPKFTSFSWLSPNNISCNHPPPPSPPESLNPVQVEEEEESDPTEFEFQLEGADVRMLPADELFSHGKLVPLQLSVNQQQPPPEEDTKIGIIISQVTTTTTPKIRVRNDPLGPGPGPINDPSSGSGYLFSPRAPTCSSRWKELLGFKRFYHKQQQQQQHVVVDNHKAAAAAAHKSLKSFLHRTQKSSVESSSSLSLPLIQQQQDASDNNNDSFSILSSRLSLSSSSCSSSGGHDHDDFPRHSLDSDFRRTSNLLGHYHRSRQLQSKEKSLLSSENLESIRTSRSNLRKDAELISADSPRMNSSGKIVFHSLERSSSSPSTLNGGPRYKYRGMERSYSANVRYTPVLNVPVCSKSAGVFGFPLFSPSQQQKKDGGGSGDAMKVNRKNRSDRA